MQRLQHTHWVSDTLEYGGSGKEVIHSGSPAVPKTDLIYVICFENLSSKFSLLNGSFCTQQNTERVEIFTSS